MFLLKKKQTQSLSVPLKGGVVPCHFSIVNTINFAYQKSVHNFAPIIMIKTWYCMYPVLYIPVSLDAFSKNKTLEIEGMSRRRHRYAL